MRDLVSIIMPVFNSERYVEEAINSVLAQTYTFWELLVIDDNSTDCSVSLIKKFVEKDQRIQLLRNDNSTGLPATPRNMGIRKARGRFIAFLDSDDIWLPDKLEKQLVLFDDPKTAIVYSDYEKISEEGVRAGRIFKAPSYVDYKCLLKGNVIGNLTGIYDTSKVGKIYFKTIHHEDYAMWLAILKQNYIARNTETITALYRVRRRSVSSQKFRLLFWQWHIYTKVEKINVFKSMYYYVNYAYRAFYKSMI